jgi:PucR-like helix-turn-helix protein
MKGLLLRLSALDADAAAALRVIAHFQALLAGDLDAGALVRSTAALAECPAGIELPDGRMMRAGPDGHGLPGCPDRITAAIGLTPAGRVWLERPGPPGPLDDLVLEWMALAATTLDTQPQHAFAPQAADPALVERVLSAHEPVADRAHALRTLGLDPAAELRITAVTCADGIDPGLAAVALFSRAALPGTQRIARLGTQAVVLHQHRPVTASPGDTLRHVLSERAAERTARPAGRPTPQSHPAHSPAPPPVPPPAAALLWGGAPYAVRAGIGGSAPALQARRTWDQARCALRFTVAGPPHEAVAEHDTLGPVALLAQIPPPRLHEQPDVQALIRLAGQPGGHAAIEALAAFCRTGSLRQAATSMHLHHSSVAARLTRAERVLDRGLRDPHDRFAAQLALYAYRLATSPPG